MSVTSVTTLLLQILSIEKKKCGTSCLPCLPHAFPSYISICTPILLFYTLLSFIFASFSTLAQNARPKTSSLLYTIFTRLRRRKRLYNIFNKSRSSSIFLAKSFEAGWFSSSSFLKWIECSLSGRMN